MITLPFGPQMEMSWTVHGDVYAAGGEVLVDAGLIVADWSRNLLTVQTLVRSRMGSRVSDPGNYFLVT